MTIINVVPMLIGALTGQLMFGIMAFLSACFVALADDGGTYQHRARAMFSAAFFITITGLVATISGTNLWLATPLMFIWAFFFSIAGVYGSQASKVGFSIICVFTLVIGLPANLHEAWIRVLAFTIGAIWALVISLWLWPLRPFRPTSQAVSEYYWALSVLLRQVYHQGQMPHWHEGVKQKWAHLQEARDKAHQIVGISRIQRPKDHHLKSLFPMLVLQADTMMEAVIALSEELSIARVQDYPQEWQGVLIQMIEQYVALLEYLAPAISDRKQPFQLEKLQRALNAFDEQMNVSYASLPPPEQGHPAYITTHNLASLLKHMSRLIRETYDLLSLQSSARIPHEMHQTKASNQNKFSRQTLYVSIREHTLRLKDNLTLRSFIMRHALRLATSLTIAVAISKLWPIPYGQWIALTIIFIMRPDYVSTRERTFQRMQGTLIGALMGAILVLVPHTNILILSMMIILSIFCFAHQYDSHIIFIQFLTAFIILMFNLITPGNWMVVIDRVINTLIGSGLCLLAGYYLWPQWEHERIPQQIEQAIRANQAYIVSVLAAYVANGDKKVELEAIRQTSHAAHAQNINLAAACQRLRNEAKASENKIECFSTLTTYNQQICNCITALAAHARIRPEMQQFYLLKRFSQQITRMLHEVEDTTSTGPRIGINLSFKSTLHEMLTALQPLLDAYSPDITERQG